MAYRKARVLTEEIDETTAVEWRTLGENGDTASWPTRAHAQGFVDNRWRIYQQRYLVQRREITPWREA